MTPVSISLVTICGLEELDGHSARGVTHVLSILDPDWADPQAFLAFDPHHRTFACSNYTPPSPLPPRKRSFGWVV